MVGDDERAKQVYAADGIEFLCADIDDGFSIGANNARTVNQAIKFALTSDDLVRGGRN